MKVGTHVTNLVRDLGRERNRRGQREAEQLHEMLVKLPHLFSQQQAADIALTYAALTPKPEENWTFVMLSAPQNAAVVRWIDGHSKRRNEAKSLWAELFTVLHPDTGEIMLARDALAARIGTAPDNVSRIMGELMTINAIRREKRGREVRYYMNSAIATHQSSTALRAKARANDGPVLAAVKGGRSDRADLEAAGQMRLV